MTEDERLKVHVEKLVKENYWLKSERGIDGVRITELLSENADLRRQLDEANDKLIKIDMWCRAYPLDVFPEPDLKEVRRLLEAGGITIDCVSASMVRHVLRGIGDILGIKMDYTLRRQRVGK